MELKSFIPGTKAHRAKKADIVETLFMFNMQAGGFEIEIEPSLSPEEAVRIVLDSVNAHIEGFGIGPFEAAELRELAIDTLRHGSAYRQGKFILGFGSEESSPVAIYL